MTTFLLIRHASHDLLGKVLAGRQPGVLLNDHGREEALHLAQHLAAVPLSAIYSSPMERATQTAAPVALRHSLEVSLNEQFHEIDFGEWMGRTFTELAADPQWGLWNNARSVAQAPGGETIANVQTRSVSEIQRLARIHSDGHVAIVSHGDVLKTALMYFLGTPLDNILRFEVSPASVSVVGVADGFAEVRMINGLTRTWC